MRNFLHRILPMGQLFLFLAVAATSIASAADLQNGVPVSGLSGATGAAVRYTFQVPAGSSNLRFQISGGSGDADLYVRFGNQPSLSAFDCRPYVDGNNETCVMPSATAGTWHVMVHGYAAFSGVTLVASLNATPSANAGLDQNVNQNTLVTLSGGGTDSDGTIASYGWVQTTGPVVAINNASAATASFIAPSVATSTMLTFRLTVTDNGGATGNDLVNVTVLTGGGGNQPPVASNACMITPAGTPIANGVLVATDPENQSLTYDLITNGKKGFVTVFSNGQYTYTPNTNLPSGDGKARGMDRFTFRATDPSGASASATVSILIDGKLRVMPVGDSITEGITDGAANPPLGQRVAYRRKLYSDLNALQPNRIDFVGSRVEGTTATPPIGDPDNQGIPGYRDYQLAASIIGDLNANPADILLLHIGTNFFDTSANDVLDILNNIDAWEISNYPVTVFLAKIIDDVPNYETALDVPAFNNNLQAMVNNRPNDRVIVVDMENGAGINYGNGSPAGSDMADNLHPNDQGYVKMANKWFAELTNATNIGLKFDGLPNCQ